MSPLRCASGIAGSLVLKGEYFSIVKQHCALLLPAHTSCSCTLMCVRDSVGGFVVGRVSYHTLWELYLNMISYCHLEENCCWLKIEEKTGKKKVKISRKNENIKELLRGRFGIQLSGRVLALHELCPRYHV